MGIPGDRKSGINPIRASRDPISLLRLFKVHVWICFSLFLKVIALLVTEGVLLIL